MTELLVDENELKNQLEELNNLKIEMFHAEEEARKRAAEPYKERIAELENLIEIAHKMVK